MDWGKLAGGLFVYCLLAPGLWVLILAAAWLVIRVVPHVEWFWR